MKATTILAFFLAVESVTAFGVVSSRTSRQTFALRYTVVEGIDEEDKEDAEDGGIRSRIGKDPAAQDLASYRDYDELSDEDYLNVDSFNEGSGIIPGFHLSSLCSDD